jgi:hypothetical protein
MATTNPDTIRVIAYREGEAWVAQCLEYDIHAQGADFQAAMRRVTAAVNAECHYTLEKHGEAFKSIDPAPTVFHEMFEATDHSLTTDKLELRIAA